MAKTKEVSKAKTACAQEFCFIPVRKRPTEGMLVSFSREMWQ